MKAWMIVVVLVVIGIVGAWIGYWIGHALGWSTDAVFPLTIGGGDRAIGLSILVSFLSVVTGLWWFVARPLRRMSRLLEAGIPGHATIRRFWRTGLFTSSGRGAARHQVEFELEMHPDAGPDYASKASGLLTEADEAELKPGAEVVVRYDRSDPSSVVVVGPMPTPV